MTTRQRSDTDRPATPHAAASGQGMPAGAAIHPRFLRLGPWALLVVVAGLFGLSFATSYAALYDYARELEFTREFAIAFPLVLDAVIVVLAVTLLLERALGRRTVTIRGRQVGLRWPSWPLLALWLFFAASVAGNVGHAPPVLAAQLVAAVPPVSAALTFHLLLRLLDRAPALRAIAERYDELGIAERERAAHRKARRDRIKTKPPMSLPATGQRRGQPSDERNNGRRPALPAGRSASKQRNIEHREASAWTQSGGERHPHQERRRRARPRTTPRPRPICRGCRREGDRPNRSDVAGCIRSNRPPAPRRAPGHRPGPCRPDRRSEWRGQGARLRRWRSSELMFDNGVVDRTKPPAQAVQPEHMRGRRTVLNMHWPPQPASYTTREPGIPVRVRIVWEHDGEQYVDGIATRWDADHVYVQLRDTRKLQGNGVWVKPADVYRASPAQPPK